MKFPIETSYFDYLGAENTQIMSSPDESTNKPTGDDVFVKPATPDLSTAVSISHDSSTRVSVHVCRVHLSVILFVTVYF